MAIDMSVSSLFCSCLLNPRAAVAEIVDDYCPNYLFMGVFILLFSHLSITISYHILNPSGLSVFGIVFEVIGAATVGFIHMVIFCSILHILMSTLGHHGSYLKLLTWDLFSQAPMSLLCSAWIVGKSFEVLCGNSVVAGLIYFLSMGILFFYTFYLLGLGIQKNYSIKNGSSVFFMIVSGIFIYALICMALFTGLTISFLGAFFNATV